MGAMRFIWFVLKMLTYGWTLFGAASAVVGVAGIPDDIATWTRWIDAMVSDPTVIWLAEYAVAIASFINQLWVRVALVIIGCVIFIWPAREFWRARHRLIFWVRNKLEDKVWITREDAIELVSNSDWALAREPTITIFDRLNSNMLRQGMTPAEKLNSKFLRLCEMMLEQFEDHYDGVTREDDGHKLISEGDLRDHLKRAYDKDVIEEFGKLPNPY